MIQAVPEIESFDDRPIPTLWGLDPVQLHDRFWASRGVQVVRQGEPSAIVKDAELFLLTARRSLVLFKLSRLVDQLSWLKPVLFSVRLHELRDHGYRETVETDDDGVFVRFNRIYGGSDSRLARVALTPDRRVAEIWQSAESAREGWRLLRRRTPRSRRCAVSVEGNVYDRSLGRELMQCVRDLIQVWKSPDATIDRARHAGQGVWSDREAAFPADRCIGSVWIGSGRKPNGDDRVIGPAALWDDPDHVPDVSDLEWQEIEPSPGFDRPVYVRDASAYRVSKRIFDIVFALGVLLFTLPFYPLVMLAIWIEDGRPFFFAHKRETIGGKEFGCIKFRSMRNDSDAIKTKLMGENRADGPQFFIDPEDDPRLTKIGWLLRKLNLDELPQFINVLKGDMSVVGPRPSPRAENQCCPPWREARLSVRPGITGLWQVMRTREEGLDFQEWIRFDIEYVERAGWSLDIVIIFKTVLILLKLND